MARREGQSLIKSLGELLDLLTRYAKEQAGSAVEDHVARPIRRASRWAAFTLVGSVFFALASFFLAIGFFLLLARILGATWAAFLLVGVLLLLGGGLTGLLRNKGDDKNGR